MKFWAAFGLFIVVFTVFLVVGHSEKNNSPHNFEENVLEYGASKVEDAEP